MAKRPIFVILGLLAASLIACGDAEDNSPITTPRPAAPAPAAQQAAPVPVQPAVPAPVAQQAAPLPVQQGIAATPSQSETTSPAPSATQPPQPKLDDDRVEGLVAEWETDLAPIAHVAACVERALGLDRPLRPEDFELQANQPAIIACVKVEVDNE